MRAKSADMSFDADDDLDTDLSAELTRLKAPDAWRKLQRQLDLAWDIRKVRGGRCSMLDSIRLWLALLHEASCSRAPRPRPAPLNPISPPKQTPRARNLQSRGKRSECECCHGSGESECRWCHGTGAMMAGDTFLRSEDGSSHCPVCKGKGYIGCENCKGTGYRATWLPAEGEGAS
jgi:hypothetical protein